MVLAVKRALTKMLYFGADHAGFQQKEILKREFSVRKIEFKDMGTDSDVSVDYPVIVKKVIEPMNFEHDHAIILCGSGQGVAIAANKFKGVRAAVCWDEKVARETRSDNNSNVLALASRYISNEQALKIALAWLETPFSNEERHARRINQIAQLEHDER